MAVFNGIYYLFSPTVASGIASNEGIRTVMRGPLSLDSHLAVRGMGKLALHFQCGPRHHHLLSRGERATEPRVLGTVGAAPQLLEATHRIRQDHSVRQLPCNWEPDGVANRGGGTIAAFNDDQWYHFRPRHDESDHLVNDAHHHETPDHNLPPFSNH